jgi:hypothetical protein
MQKINATPEKSYKRQRVTYPDPDLTPDYTAVCEGTEEFNGFCGEGIVDAFAASKKRR